MRWTWLGLRLFVVGWSLLGGLSMPLANTNLDWVSCTALALLPGTMLFGWLSLRWRQGELRLGSDDLSPFSPLWPMMTYPIQSWLVSGISALAIGIGLAVQVVLFHPDKIWAPLTLIACAASILGSLALWIVIHRRGDP
jgi:hypothetical protein